MVSREITTTFWCSKKISNASCRWTHLVGHTFLSLVAYVFISTLVIVLKSTSHGFGILKKLYTVQKSM
jgi:hypothetical protein